jgi:hypothetical protein
MNDIALEVACTVRRCRYESLVVGRCHSFVGRDRFLDRRQQGHQKRRGLKHNTLRRHTASVCAVNIVGSAIIRKIRIWVVTAQS